MFRDAVNPSLEKHFVMSMWRTADGARATLATSTCLARPVKCLCIFGTEFGRIDLDTGLNCFVAGGRKFECAKNASLLAKLPASRKLWRPFTHTWASFHARRGLSP